jgi:5-methyltetrahydrofolate--homocysteine methyltransferase
LIIVGERLNTTRKVPAAIVKSRDGEALVREAERQKEAGADYLDVNAGTFGNGETDALCWMVETIQASLDVPLCIDSSNPVAIAAALRLHKGKALINSITLERVRFEPVLALVREYGTGVVALCLDDEGLPHGAEEAVTKGRKLVEMLLDAGVPAPDIYLDPLVRSLGTDPAAGLAVIESIRQFMQDYPGIHTICGLSNISFGMPKRAILNRAFLVAAMTAGLDTAILDPLDRDLMGLLAATEAVLGRDRYGLGYIRACRRGALD